jgi:hypothetical protein
MENLLQKIKEYTANGSPSVGQLIELNDLGKKVGIKRNDLDKLISEHVAAQKQDDFARKPVITAPTDYRDASRNLENQRPIFEDRREFFERKEEENRNFDSNSFGTSTFEKKEVSFEETNRNFENANKTGVKNTNYPDSKEREAEINKAHNQTTPLLTIEEKIALVSKELQLAVNARRIQGLAAYTEKEFFEITNQIRQKYGLHKLKESIAEIKKEAVEIEEAPTIKAVVFDEHLDDDLKVDSFEFDEPLKKETPVSYDQIMGIIKKEILSINASNFYNGYKVTKEEYVALHNTFFEKYGLQKIYRIEECVVPFPEVTQEVPKTEKKEEPVSNTNYTQSKEEVARQLEILRKKEVEKQAELEKKVRQKKLLEEMDAKIKTKTLLLNELKATRILAFVSLGLSVLISGIAGVILGGITLIRLGELQKKIRTSEVSGNTETTQLLNTIRWVGVVAFAIGAVKTLIWIGRFF